MDEPKTKTVEKERKKENKIKKICSELSVTVRRSVEMSGESMEL